MTKLLLFAYNVFDYLLAKYLHRNYIHVIEFWLSVHCFLKVLVTGHVPPGIAAEGGRSWFYQHFNTRMVHILQQYSDVIIGLHFGHEHADTFRIFYDHSGIHDYYIDHTFRVDFFLLKYDIEKLIFFFKCVPSNKIVLTKFQSCILPILYTLTTMYSPVYK